MRCHPFVAFALGSFTVLLLSATVSQPVASGARDPAGAAPPQDPQGEMAAAMAKMKQWTAPGKHHESLAQLVGKWNTKTTMFMGGQTSPPEAGTSEFRWLMPGRWLIAESKGSMMGMPMQTCWLMGYDNFKQSYVTTTVNSMDTAMLRFEGDLTQDGKALISYGTLDEYMTGEHDKMVKSVFRFLSDTEFVVEVHDLPIGETGTKVFEVRYTKS